MGNSFRIGVVGLLLLSCSCTLNTQGGEKSAIATSLEDSIRDELDLQDSIKVLKAQYYPLGNQVDHVYDFIDYNKKSRFHDALLKGIVNNSPAEWSNYTDLYKQISDSLKDLAITLTDKHLLKTWIPIYKYQDKFYFYSGCSFQMGFKITDTAVINFYSDGPYPWIMAGIKQLGNTSIIHAVNGQRHRALAMELVDSTYSIYRATENNWCAYYIPVEHIHDFPIIVQHCHEEADNLLEFDTVCE